MKSILIICALLASGCTLSNGVVKDLHLDSGGKLVQTKCDLKYFALYTLVVDERNCADTFVK